MTPITARRRALRPSRLLVAGAAAALALTGCANSGETDAPAAAASSGDGGAQTTKSASAPAGEGCTLEKYGLEAIDLKGAKVGFSQSEPDTAAFRAAETQSIKDEAAKIGVGELLVTNANAQLTKQISDIQDLLNQGAQALIVAPVNSDGLDPALAAAKAKGVPVLTIDRKVTNTACSDYLAFIGSDFEEQGKRAADAMATATGGPAKVAILLGSSGNNVTDLRTSGFVDQVEAEYPELEIVAQQTGDFERAKGQSVAEQLLQSNPDINAIYAENDEMGLGAVQAVLSAGKQPGTDVKIVSIDGTRNAVQALVDGQYNGVIESNPRFGPLAFSTLQDFMDGKEIPEDIIIEDDEYTPDNAEAELANAF
ncbi:ABC transporter substrate-binding protein [Modestobacter muralis]|uniref:ABC transporter substrate-binding protein n=1 Tax=Modestobacter muralis TaxID=1608614 RepID=A0A6P0H6G2_9ACTN|nr:ABC transporter substrate-binding protein [Modestobacter muralis]NEK94374.1 ABC transporter substrate-binding protein [Modestobacter muralis]NEN51262.1 ABC transporter substrate-binding protein [Modestobacter muralis]